jgi:hypothetical protein
VRKLKLAGVEDTVVVGEVLAANMSVVVVI